MMVLNAGRIEQIGTPHDVYHRPASIFVAGFIGSPGMNLIPVNVQQGAVLLRAAQQPEQRTVLKLSVPTNVRDAVTLGFRPEHLSICQPDHAVATIQIDVIEALGAESFGYGTLFGHAVTIRLHPEAAVKAGDQIPVTVPASYCHWFDQQGRRIAV